MSPITETIIQEATAADIPTLSRHIEACKQELSSMPGRPSDATQFVTSSLEDIFTTCLKAVETTSARIVGQLFVTSGGGDGGGSGGTRDRRGSIGTVRPCQFLQAPVTSAEEAIAQAMRWLRPDIRGDYLELVHIYVDPAYRRQGIGTQLVRLCRDRARFDRLPLSVCTQPKCHEFFLNRRFGEAKRSDIDLRAATDGHARFGVIRFSRMYDTVCE
ncbi:hypothetical protein F5Y04DRAFT_290094 [Hypomontagnella monticulosa]|nr:hypothetical protein F5Y04DRAFT_290094 [Hypomontagnella monticulosa]